MSETTTAEMKTNENKLNDSEGHRAQHDEIVNGERKQPLSHSRLAIGPSTRSISMSKQLSSHRTKPQAKVTIVGTDRSTFACALTMGLRRHVSEIIIYDQSYNAQMKTCFDDVSEPIEVAGRDTFSCYVGWLACMCISTLFTIAFGESPLHIGCRTYISIRCDYNYRGS
jgi:hypothetical protein